MRTTIFCTHYRAMSEHKTCEAGVEYEKFKGVPFDQRPCFARHGEPPPGGWELAQFPTPEELARQEVEDAKPWADIVSARTAIVEACGGPWKRGTPGTSGRIDCPVCAGVKTLGYSRAGYNGHVHAKCSTANCVSWME